MDNFQYFLLPCIDLSLIVEFSGNNLNDMPIQIVPRLQIKRPILTIIFESVISLFTMQGKISGQKHILVLFVQHGVLHGDVVIRIQVDFLFCGNKAILRDVMRHIW